MTHGARELLNAIEMYLDFGELDARRRADKADAEDEEFFCGIAAGIEFSRRAIVKLTTGEQAA